MKRTYTWDTLIPADGKISKSKRVSSKVLEVGDISLTLKGTRSLLVPGGNSYQIEIEKTNHTVVGAAIVLSLTNIDRAAMSLINWGSSPCSLLSWPKPFNWTPTKTYTFVCEITWRIPQPIPWHYFNAHDCLKKFLMSPTYCDVKIVIGTEILNAHKIILASRSNVFDTMLTAPMKEVADNEIIIKDIDLDVMKTVLTFLYTGEEGALNDFQMASRCLETAEKYQIQDLKRLYEYKLYKYIKAETVIAILSAADMYQAEKLKNECFIFIAENQAEIIPKPEFQQMCIAKPHLKVRFMETLMTHI